MGDNVIRYAEAGSVVIPRRAVEAFAIRAALGNNGGEWATHYTEEQKEHWRRFVLDIASEIAKAMERVSEKIPDRSRAIGA
jgi:hypothetical protein